MSKKNPLVMSAKAQLDQLKIEMGLNILEVAAILRVTRPTIYKWLEEEEPKLRKNHQARLKSIYDICQHWTEKKAGPLECYLHQPLGSKNASLFKLLTSKTLDKTKINDCLEQIAKTIEDKRKQDAEHEALLKKHGFEPVSKEDMDRQLLWANFLD